MLILPINFVSLLVTVISHEDSTNRAAVRNMPQEGQEIFVIIQANAASQPRAMMVHSHDASITDRAMVGPWGSD